MKKNLELEEGVIWSHAALLMKFNKFFGIVIFRGIPGMPGMEMYSREDIEKMRDQLGPPKKEVKEEESEENIYQGEDVSFFQMIMDGLTKLWSWIKNLFGFRKGKSDEL